MMAPEEYKESFSESEKEELLKKFAALEEKYGALDEKHNALVKKYEEELAKKDTTVHSTDEATEVQTQISNALNEVREIAAEVRSCSSARNKERIEQLDQYGRRNMLLLIKFLYPEKLYGLDFIIWIVDELNKMFPDLKVPVQVSHIDDAHPLPSRNGDSKVVIKFANRWMKNEIYKRRAQLKDTAYKNISITEQLTSHTQSLLNTTRTVVGKDTKVFTNNCVISLKFNQRKYTIKNFKDVQYLAKKLATSYLCHHQDTRDFFQILEMPICSDTMTMAT